MAHRFLGNLQNLLYSLPKKKRELIQIGVHFLYYISLRMKLVIWGVIHPHISVRINSLGEDWDMEKGALGTKEKEGNVAGGLPQFLFSVRFCV